MVIIAKQIQRVIIFTGYALDASNIIFSQTMPT